MRRWLALPVLGLAVLVARPVGAEEPKTYTVPTRDTWKVGDVVTVKSTEKTVNGQIVKGADGGVLQEKTTEGVELHEYVIKVLEVDPAGEYTKANVYFKTWSHSAGETDDKTLEGKHVEVIGVGEGRTARVVPSAANLSPEATSWLDEKFGKESAKKAKGPELMVPKKPVAIGESTDIDMVALTAAMKNDQMSFLGEKSTGKFTLKDVKDGVATIAIAVALQADGVNGGQLPWSDGGILSINMEGTKSLDAGAHASMRRMTGGLKGTLTIPVGIVELDTTIEGEEVTTVGGEMPAVPEAK